MLKKKPGELNPGKGPARPGPARLGPGLHSRPPPPPPPAPIVLCVQMLPRNQPTVAYTSPRGCLSIDKTHQVSAGCGPSVRPGAERWMERKRKNLPSRKDKHTTKAEENNYTHFTEQYLLSEIRVLRTGGKRGQGGFGEGAGVAESRRPRHRAGGELRAGAGTGGGPHAHRTVLLAQPDLCWAHCLPRVHRASRRRGTRSLKVGELERTEAFTAAVIPGASGAR